MENIVLITKFSDVSKKSLYRLLREKVDLKEDIILMSTVPDIAAQDKIVKKIEWIQQNLSKSIRHWSFAEGYAEDYIDSINENNIQVSRILLDLEEKLGCELYTPTSVLSFLKDTSNKVEVVYDVDGRLVYSFDHNDFEKILVVCEDETEEVCRINLSTIVGTTYQLKYVKGKLQLIQEKELETTNLYVYSSPTTISLKWTQNKKAKKKSIQSESIVDLIQKKQLNNAFQLFDNLLELKIEDESDTQIYVPQKQLQSIALELSNRILKSY